MAKHSFIRGSLAVFILVVFAFSITPKIILHNMVANHKDTAIASNFEKNAQLHKAGFNCCCDNLVVESPFTKELDLFNIPVVIFFPSPVIRNTDRLDTRLHFYLRFRGPPVGDRA